MSSFAPRFAFARRLSPLTDVANMQAHVKLSSGFACKHTIGVNRVIDYGPKTVCEVRIKFSTANDHIYTRTHEQMSKLSLIKSGLFFGLI